MIELTFLKELILKKQVHPECHYCYFLDKGFPQDVCNGCHDVLIMSINLSDIAILNIQAADYRCIINGISKSDVVNVLQNASFTDKRGLI